ncbi:rRNA methyltransferase [Lysobacter sp. A6]|uniref:rRNA methyltransferase n=1 Tax=Noviluteimonas lactosilytica TaxID=2888523 RepID=A0ABS8JKI3_9GAMM|nr:rRNA methyltransferase [Lysobacter lactosilyticus]
MSERESPWKSKRGPRPPDERAPRETRGARPPREHRPRNEAPHHEAPHHETGADEHAHAREHRDTELRLYGVNAVRAAFHRRPDALRKLYLVESRIPQLQPMLRWCVAHRLGYRVVEDEADLQRLTGSAHHEGVVADMLREPQATLTTWLQHVPAGPVCALWLDGVGNPHNLGAILRSAAHFGVSAILLPKHSTLTMSGAAARVAEGGAEAVPFVRLGREDNALSQLRGAGFALAATVVRDGTPLFEADLPQRLVYVLGAEGEGMSPALAQACDTRVSIPGSGKVESLNVAAATAVLLAEWSRRVVRHP